MVVSKCVPGACKVTDKLEKNLIQILIRNVRFLLLSYLMDTYRVEGDGTTGTGGQGDNQGN